MKRLVCRLFGHKWGNTTLSYWVRTPNTDWGKVTKAGPQVCGRCKRWAENVTTSMEGAEVDWEAARIQVEPDEHPVYGGK